MSNSDERDRETSDDDSEASTGDSGAESESKGDVPRERARRKRAKETAKWFRIPLQLAERVLHVRDLEARAGAILEKADVTYILRRRDGAFDRKFNPTDYEIPGPNLVDAWWDEWFSQSVFHSPHPLHSPPAHFRHR